MAQDQSQPEMTTVTSIAENNSQFSSVAKVMAELTRELGREHLITDPPPKKELRTFSDKVGTFQEQQEKQDPHLKTVAE